MLLFSISLVHAHTQIFRHVPHLCLNRGSRIRLFSSIHFLNIILHKLITYNHRKLSLSHTLSPISSLTLSLRFSQARTAKASRLFHPFFRRNLDSITLQGKVSWSLPSRSHSLKFRKLQTKYFSVAHLISLSLTLLNNYLTNKSKSFYFLKLFLAWGFWFRLNQIFPLSLTQPSFCSLSFVTLSLSNLRLSFSHTHTHSLKENVRGGGGACSVCLLLTQINNKKWKKKTIFFCFPFRLFYTTFLCFLSLSRLLYLHLFPFHWNMGWTVSVCVCVIFFLFLAHVCVCVSEWMWFF